MVLLLQDANTAATNGVTVDVQLQEIRPTEVIRQDAEAVTVEVPSETVAESPVETNTGCQHHTISTSDNISEYLTYIVKLTKVKDHFSQTQAHIWAPAGFFSTRKQIQG